VVSEHPRGVRQSEVFLPPGQILSQFRNHDKWIRHRLRALHLKHWKRGPKVYAELRKLGVAPIVAKRVAANTRRWWRNSAMLVQVGLDTRYFDRRGVPKLAD
jgi:RNA-directed DNA polymerase